MPWKPEVRVDGEWHRNGLVFATRDEAFENAADLFARWTSCAGYRAAEVPDAMVTHSYTGRELRPIDDTTAAPSPAADQSGDSKTDLTGDKQP